MKLTDQRPELQAKELNKEDLTEDDLAIIAQMQAN